MGITIPKLLGFESLKTEHQRQKGFALFVDHLAERAENEDATFPADHAGPEALVNRVDVGEIAGLALRRTQDLDKIVIKWRSKK